MSRLSNALTMIELLSTGKKYSVNELADILEVSTRMVRSYKDDLEKAGIYVDTIYGKYGGYVLNNHINLPKRRFKKSDYEFLSSLKVSKKDQKRVDELADKIRGIYFNSSLYKEELNDNTKPIFNILNQAIKEQRKVKILYYSFTKGENERVIQPYDLFLYSTGWGVSAYCELRNDIRHFELKRINKIEILDEFF